MPMYRYHLDSQVKVVADSIQENPATLAEAGQRDGFISATITTGGTQKRVPRTRAGWRFRFEISR